MKRILLPFLLLMSLVLNSCNEPDNAAAKAEADEMFAEENQYLFGHYAVGDSVVFIRENGEKEDFVVLKSEQAYTEFSPKGIIAEPPTYIVGKEAHLCLRGTRYQIEIDVFVTIRSPYTNKGIRTDFLLRDDTPDAGLTTTDLAIPETKENERVIAGTSHLYMQPEADAAAYCLLRKDAGIVEIQDAYGRRFVLP